MPRFGRPVHQVSRSQGMYRLPPMAPRRASRGSTVLRSSLLVLAVYALGLIPFYFLTPVHDTLPRLLFPVSETGSIAPGLSIARPNPSKSEVKQKVGADSASVAAPTAVNAQAAAAVPADAANDPRYAFVLLGYGGAGHDGAYLSDSMIVVIVDADRKTLTLVSVPRDSWVPMTFDGKTAIYNKINTAYAFGRDPSLYPDRLPRYMGDNGAGVFAADTVSRLLGVPIRYYMGIDFHGFRDMINTVGGVDVDVPASFSARYPANDDPSIDASWMTVRFTKGIEHMTGERAIEFARARETLDNIDEGSDFARSRRQRLIIEAFKNRTLQPGGLIHLPQLVGIASTHIDTNFSVPDVAGLSKLALDWKDVHIYQTALTTSNYLEDATGPDGTYATVPRSSTHTWSQIAALMQKIWADPASGVAISQTHLVVENDTGVAGAAARETAILTSLGYLVDSPVSGSVRSASRLLDPSGHQLALPLVPSLRKDLGLRSLEVADDTVDPTASFTLQLGSDDLAAIPSVVPTDRSSPTSAVGIEKFGVWAPDSGSAVDPPTAVSNPTAPLADSTHRTPTPARGAIATTTPDGSGHPTPSPNRTPAKPTVVHTPTPNPR